MTSHVEIESFVTFCAGKPTDAITLLNDDRVDIVFCEFISRR
jgi:hypothetical protein